MNLQELDQLIAAIPKDDQEMITFYNNKRKELVAEIQAEINKLLRSA
jgi:hypothetical protein